MIGELTNHVWQSSLFACAAAMLAFALRRNRAHVRYWVWLTASLKFLIPFSLLIGLGSRLAWTPAAKTIPSESVPLMIAQFTQPFPNTPPALAPRPEHFVWLPLGLLGVWACGVAVAAVIRIREWLRIRAVVRASVPLKMPCPIGVRTSVEPMEPGVVGLDLFGMSRPVLLLPAGLTENLTPPQLEAVVAHELCHVRRRDNLTAAMHMLVEAIVWFHPFVWWIGARLLEERERACDEDVLRLGNEPRIYAEGILNVCKLYTESSLTCVSGVTGSNLKQRIERIMRKRVGSDLNSWRKFLLATATIVVLAGPFIQGALMSPLLRAQSQAAESEWEAKAGGKAKFDVASVKQDLVPRGPGTAYENIPLGAQDEFTPTGGLFSARNIYLYEYLAFAYKLTRSQTDAIKSQAPKWANADRYDIEARAAGNTTKDQFRLMMQSLLLDRFKLAVHWEKRQLPVFALVLAKPGKMGPQLRLHPANSDCSSQPPDGPPVNGGELPTVAGGFPEICGVTEIVHPNSSGHLRMGGRNIPIGQIAKSPLLLGAMGIDRPIIDKTGITGDVDFVVEFAPEGSVRLGPKVTIEPDPDGPNFLTAFKEQLGIKIEPQTAMVDVFVVDHIEEPSPN
jgi:bla regulator protein BlaR1